MFSIYDNICLFFIRAVYKNSVFADFLNIYFQINYF